MSAAQILRHIAVVAVGASHWCCHCHIPVPHWNELLDFEVLSWLLLFKQTSCLPEQKTSAVKCCSRVGHLQARLGDSQQTPLPYAESSMNLARILTAKSQILIRPEHLPSQWPESALCKNYPQEVGSIRSRDESLDIAPWKYNRRTHLTYNANPNRPNLLRFQSVTSVKCTESGRIAQANPVLLTIWHSVFAPHIAWIRRGRLPPTVCMKGVLLIFHI